MPKVVEKRKILGGRGAVVLYGSGSSAGEYFYRELIPGTKQYKTRKIPNVSNIEEAAEAAIEIAFQLNNQPGVSIVLSSSKKTDVIHRERDYITGKVIDRRPRKQAIADAINAFIEQQQKRADAGLITDDYVKQRKSTFINHILPYLNSKLVLWTNEINIRTFEDYPIWRAETTALMRRQELKWIKEWCKDYLVKNGYIQSSLVIDKAFLPKVQIKQTDLMKNPAINEDDWKLLIDFVRNEWRHRPLQWHKQTGWYFRNLFWHWILFAKNTGMSPEEIMKLKWKQIEIVDVGRINSKGEKVSWEIAYIRTIRSKTQQAREIPANQARELKRWKKWVEDYLAEKGLDFTITKDSYVFPNPANRMEQYSQSTIRDNWIQLRDELDEQFTGHRFSPHKYTLYSLRSTFIEDHLLKGTPVMEVAEMAGHSIVETQKTYAKLNLRKKGREITLPQLGKRIQGEGERIDLFDSTD